MAGMTALEETDAAHGQVVRVVLEAGGRHPDLMTLSMIAKDLAISRQRAWQLTRKRDFPQPVARTPSGPLWTADAVSAWLLSHRRLQGGA